MAKEGESVEGLEGYKNTDYRPVNPKDITVGQNNNYLTEEIKVNFTMVDNYNLRLFLSDNKADPKNVHEVADKFFQRPVYSWEARLTQMNFKIEEKKFEWSIGNIYSKNEILSTANRKLFMSDKYSEIGFVLPSKRCYGLGQRNAQFQLEYGSYTLHSRFRPEGL